VLTAGATSVEADLIAKPWFAVLVAGNAALLR
jgi:hypothetical protein